MKFHHTIRVLKDKISNPRFGQVVKEDNVLRGIWKLGKIDEMVKWIDGHFSTVSNGRYTHLPNNKSIIFSGNSQ